jgi:hypothetical protein
MRPNHLRINPHVPNPPSMQELIAIRDRLDRMAEGAARLVEREALGEAARAVSRAAAICSPITAMERIRRAGQENEPQEHLVRYARFAWRDGDLATAEQLLGAARARGKLAPHVADLAEPVDAALAFAAERKAVA